MIPAPVLGDERFSCLHLQGGIVLYLHMRLEQVQTFRGARTIWRQVYSIVDNGRGLYGGPHTDFDKTHVLARTEISRVSFEALKAKAENT